MTLRGARILSSCNDASNKQEQKMNVNIRVEDNSKHNIPTNEVRGTFGPQQIQQPAYPQVQPVNFTTQEQLTPEPSQYPSVVASPILQRDINLEESLAKDSLIQDLETKNKFLNLLLTVYQNNPIYINSYVICDAQILMSMIKLLTNCDKVDLVLNEDIACSGCTGNDKLIYVSKILVTKGDRTEDLKYCYNEVYSKFVSYGISLKIVC